VFWFTSAGMLVYLAAQIEEQPERLQNVNT